ncbi:hypothetical protein CTAYLR_002441 [Chrysophaeum taylorii]|uniref:Uncharacterized protein n=1 Tax=Chrysophaeum taylorii TaxID=2483200 RepID=A0AAD7UNC3_9STRA|nr:hypothetical protein CTAYLR_002441 [Chrysophaeum taylorii]
MESTWSALFEMPTRLRLFGRRLQVYGAAYLIYSKYKSAEKAAAALQANDDDAAAVAALWSRTHRECASIAAWHAKSLLGLWCKLAQFMSSRADVMPEEWIEALATMQDAVPARPFWEVAKTIEEEWGVDDVSVVLSWIEPKPIASASIAQVHAATVKSTGEKIALKVQHRQVAAVIEQDLENAAYLVAYVARERPEWDFRPILNEWCDETRRELDFELEARSTEEVAGFLAAAAADATERETPFPRAPRVVRAAAVPRAPFAVVDDAKCFSWSRIWRRRDDDDSAGRPRYVVRPTKRLLPLEFIDGFKPTDATQIEVVRPGGPASVLEDLAAAFAHNIFVDGVFNGDPHPGNMLVSRAEKGRVVLLDFGLTKRLKTKSRLAIAQLVVAASDGDVSGVLRATRALGLDDVVDEPSAAVNVVRFLFRDASPRVAVSRADADDPAPHRPRFAPTRRRRRTSDDDDDPEVAAAETTAASLPLRHFRRQFHEDDAKAEDVDDDDEDDEDDEQAAAPDYLSSATGKMYPKLATPGTILFVLRVIGCLRGIATQLGVSQSYLRALRPHARAALERDQQRRGAPVRVDRPLTPLRQRIAGKLHHLCDSGAACAIQLCAYVDGELVANESRGELGPADPRPTAPDTLFSVFSCGKGVAAALALALVEDGAIDLDAFFVDQRNSRLHNFFTTDLSLTPRSLLEHTSGLSSAWPPKFSAAMATLDADYFASTDAKGTSRAWRDAVRWFRTRAAPARHERGIFHYHAVSFGWLVGGMSERAAGLGYQDLLESRLARPLGIDKHVFAQLPSPTKHSTDDDDDDDDDDDYHDQVWDRLATVCVREEDVAALRGDADDAFGMDPRLINEVSLRALLLPSSTVHASAYGLATMYAALANAGALADGRRLVSEGTARSFAFNFAAACRAKQNLGLNCAPFGFRPYVLSGSDRCQDEHFAFGHAGLGQLHAFGDPETRIAVACVVNKLSSDPTCAFDALAYAVDELGGGRIDLP